MTLDEMREQEAEARKRLGGGSENPDGWEVEGNIASEQAEAVHALDGIELGLTADGMNIYLGAPAYEDGESRYAFVPAAVLVKMMAELRAVIGATDFDDVYGVPHA